MQMNTPNWTWEIPLVVSIVALSGVVATAAIQYRSTNRQLRASNALKIAEMRQKWIDSLRDSMARLSGFYTIDKINEEKRMSAQEQLSKIPLMMTLKDKDYGALKEPIQDVQALSAPQREDAWLQYVGICQRILKREWETCKREIRSAGDKPEPDPPLWFRDRVP